MGYDDGRGRGTILAGFQEWIVARYGIGAELVFWVPVLGEALPGIADASDLSPAEHAVAVDKLFELLLQYLSEGDRP
jgi:hypothetical protein